MFISSQRLSLTSRNMTVFMSGPITIRSWELGNRFLALNAPGAECNHHAKYRLYCVSSSSCTALKEANLCFTVQMKSFIQIAILSSAIFLSHGQKLKNPPVN